MEDYTKTLPEHEERYVGEHDLFLEIYQGLKEYRHKTPLLLVHGAYTGSWMWSKYIPILLAQGWDCYVMNLRGHYKSRAVDLTTCTFHDYVDDVKEILAQCKTPPILIGFSLGGILCQKIAEHHAVAGMVLIDSTLSKQLKEKAPYASLSKNCLGMIEPAPVRMESCTIDESENDIAFQVKYNAMESAKVFSEIGCWMEGVEGISIHAKDIQCKTLVIKSINKQEHIIRGRSEADFLHGEYIGFEGCTHTGLLIGQRYHEVLASIISWLVENEK